MLTAWIISIPDRRRKFKQYHPRIDVKVEMVNQHALGILHKSQGDLN